MHKATKNISHGHKKQIGRRVAQIAIPVALVVILVVLIVLIYATPFWM